MAQQPFAYPFPQHGIAHNDDNVAGQFHAAMNAAAHTAAQNPFAIGGQQVGPQAVIPPPVPKAMSAQLPQSLIAAPAGGFGHVALRDDRLLQVVPVALVVLDLAHPVFPPGLHEEFDAVARGR